MFKLFVSFVYLFIYLDFDCGFKFHQNGDFQATFLKTLTRRKLLRLKFSRLAIFSLLFQP